MIFGRPPLSLLGGCTGFIFSITVGLFRFLNSLSYSRGVLVSPDAVIFSTYFDFASLKPLLVVAAVGF